MTRSDVSPWAIRGLYLFALVLAASPMMDLLSTVWPMRPSELPWRYGFLGLTAGYLHTPILGLVLALAVAQWNQNGTLMRGLGALMMVSAVMLVLVMGLFMLDVLQIRGMREESVRSAVLVGGLLQEVKYGTAVLVLAALGLGAFRTGAGHVRRGGRAKPGIVASGS